MTERIGCIADKRMRSQHLKNKLVEKFKLIDCEKANGPFDVIIICGGDGTLLHTIHNHLDKRTKFYGINSGNVGFLMNDQSILELEPNDFQAHMQSLKPIKTVPLKMTVIKNDKSSASAIAINEVSLLRNTYQTAHLEISIDGQIEMKELIADGVLVSTPAGSTAYNFSAGGPIMPLSSNLLTVTPISPFRPRRWRGALIPQTANIKIKVISSQLRPVNAVADFIEFNDVKEVHISTLRDKTVTLLFNEHKTLDDRILKEQFST